MTNSSGGSRPSGDPTPTLSVVPEFSSSLAASAAYLASAYGMTPDAWQALVLEGWLGRLDDGTWSASRCGLTVPRQNGKNGVLEIVELFKMVGLGRRVLHTAHEVKTSRKAFLRLASFFENKKDYPELARLVASIRRTNGQEAIILRNGGACEFIARSSGSGRGFTVDDLVCDEAQELTDDALAALLPALSAAPSGMPQTFLIGTPPRDAARGEAFAKERGLAQEGGDGRLAWFEWSNPPDVDPEDDEAVARANPAVGVRITWGAIDDERRLLGAQEFARERLGIWESVSSNAVIDPDVWRSFADADSSPSGRVAFAVDVPPEGRRASIARAGLRADGRAHVEVDVKSGTTWTVERLAELAKKRNAVVALDGGSRAAALIPRLVEAGVTPVVYGARDVVTACSGFMDRVDEDGLRHLGQPEFSTAVDGARRRKVGDAWAWQRRDTGVDISPLVAATLAVHALKEDPPKRKTGRVLAV